MTLETSNPPSPKARLLFRLALASGLAVVFRQLLFGAFKRQGHEAGVPEGDGPQGDMGWLGGYIYSYWDYKPTYNWGGTTLWLCDQSWHGSQMKLAWATDQVMSETAGDGEVLGTLHKLAATLKRLINLGSTLGDQAGCTVVCFVLMPDAGTGTLSLLLQ